MKHKHADVIKAWADGAEIEWLNAGDGRWYPLVDAGAAYRIKPPEPSKLAVLKKAWQDASKAAAPAYEAYWAELHKEKK